MERSAVTHAYCWCNTRYVATLSFLVLIGCFPSGCGAFVCRVRNLQLTHEPARRSNGLVERRLGALAADPTPRSSAKEKEENELRQLTWLEVEDRIIREVAETGAAAVIVPVGATEQHGPNGLIGTDHMTAEAVARGVSEASGAILAPSINYGMSHHHESFPGTVTLRPATFVAVMRDVASSLSKTGFTHVLFINGHGGNVGPAFKAFADFAAEQEDRDRHRQPEEENGGGDGGDGSSGGSSGGNSRARVKLVSWYAGRESSALAKELYGGEVGQHATPDEVAMTQHLFPKSIKTGVELDPAAIQVAKDLGGMTKRFKDEDTGLSVMDVEDFRRRFPDGRMFSNPGLSTPEHGRRLLEAAVRDATEALGKFLSGQDQVEEAEMKAKRAAAMEAAAAGEAAAAAAGAAAGVEPKRPTRNAEFRARPRWGDDDGKGRAGRGRRGGELAAQSGTGPGGSRGCDAPRSAIAMTGGTSVWLRRHWQG